ncbi:hypothetical protein KDV94_13650 [Providencia rettgeri]|uniref:hypothetical protein n=1 Tax=Providencia rettgeri TaxID=587 RepID=UPI000F477501|nr:hypothetical protein [Providencia rettgeri]MCG5290837.1 hypothetical protein [Providencia rettgeri]
MAKWEVKFDIRKGNNSMVSTETVEAENESTALILAENNSKRSHSSQNNQGYTWSARTIKRK